MYYVYILKSKKDKKFYIGYTSNMAKRLQRHNAGKVIATRGRRPLELIYTEKYKAYKKAIGRERYLKKLKSHKYIEWMIRQN